MTMMMMIMTMVETAKSTWVSSTRHMRWKTVPEVGAENWKSPFADSREVERRYCKLVGGCKPESLPGWLVSDSAYS